MGLKGFFCNEFRKLGKECAFITKHSFLSPLSIQLQKKEKKYSYAHELMKVKGLSNLQPRDDCERPSLNQLTVQYILYRCAI